MSMPYYTTYKLSVRSSLSFSRHVLGRKAAERACRAGGMVPAAQTARRSRQARSGVALDSIAVSGLPTLQGQGVPVQAPVGPDPI